ncbi:hypothetical protein NHQ30_009732 [Ciborinia camelliae]|nr:hypothetical protein NHQ30_009732 [Ciborinia camelliae]
MAFITLPAKEKIESTIEDQADSPPPFAVVAALKSTKIKDIREKDEYHFYGIVSSKVIATEAARFVANNSRASKSSLKKIFKKFLAITSQDSQEKCQVKPEAVWFLVRMTQKSDEYIVPRWHRDGGMMVNCKDASHTLHTRYATALVGPPTLVLQETEMVTKAMVNFPANRKGLSDALTLEVPLDISRKQIIRFSWGEEDSPVHSEPNLVTERVFVSCIYGSIDEIREITRARKQFVDFSAFFRTGEEEQKEATSCKLYKFFF